VKFNWLLWFENGKHANPIEKTRITNTCFQPTSYIYFYSCCCHKNYVMLRQWQRWWWWHCSYRFL